MSRARSLLVLVLAIPALVAVGSAAHATQAAPHPPALRITTAARPGTAPGLLITNPIKIYTNHPESWTDGPTIYDNAGHVVWYKPATSIHVTEPVTYAGKPALAYYQITKVLGGWNAGYWVVLNQSYQKVAEIHAGDGLMADHHE